MIYKEKCAWDKFSHINSDRNSVETFDNARDEVINVLKRHNFNVEESKMLLNQVNEDISDMATDLVYSQELKNLF